MTQEMRSVPIQILGKTYHIRCPRESAEKLQRAANLLDDETLKIRDSNKVVGFDQVLVITALNICHDLLDERDRNKVYETQTAQQIQQMQKRIEEVLTQKEQMELE